MNEDSFNMKNVLQYINNRRFFALFAPVLFTLFITLFKYHAQLNSFSEDGIIISYLGFLVGCIFYTVLISVLKECMRVKNLRRFK